MPASNVTVYAKWEINTFKVFRTNISIVIEDEFMTLSLLNRFHLRRIR